jgi:oligopeptide/dipeptide ABC transporter ATP-binding protein
VRHISSRIGVMYLGLLVEICESKSLYKNPMHPYTKALLSSIPIPDPDKASKIRREIIKGDVPSPINIPRGCRFNTRCPFVLPICKEQQPPMKEIEKGHLVACHLY